MHYISLFLFAVVNMDVHVVAEPVPMSSLLISIVILFSLNIALLLCVCRERHKTSRSLGKVRTVSLASQRSRSAKHRQTRFRSERAASTSKMRKHTADLCIENSVRGAGKIKRRSTNKLLKKTREAPVSVHSLVSMAHRPSFVAPRLISHSQCYNVTENSAKRKFWFLLTCDYHHHGLSSHTIPLN